jgi:hypothetical protein
MTDISKVAKSGTLTAGGPATTVVVGMIRDGVTVINRSQTGELWVRLDGQDPTVAGDDCFVVLGARTFTPPDIDWAMEIRMISSQALNYSVESHPHMTRYTADGTTSGVQQ